MTTIEYIAKEAARLVKVSNKAFIEWYDVINNPDSTEGQIRDAAVAFFEASAAADAVKTLYLDLLAKGVNT